MNCETCDSQLLDLLYEELAPAHAEEMRVHLADCASCSAAYAKISQGMEFAMQLPMLEPSVAVEGAIMDIARSRISGLPQAATARPLDVSVGVERDVDAGLLERVVDWLRDFATGPQAAMATVMLLVMAIGVWYVPHGAPTTFEATGTTLMSPDPEGEAVPAPLSADEAELAEVVEEDIGAGADALGARREQGRVARQQRARSNRRPGRGGASRSGSAGRDLALDDALAERSAPPRAAAPAPAMPSAAAEPAPEPTMRRSRAATSGDGLTLGGALVEESEQARPASTGASTERARQAGSAGYAADDEASDTDQSVPVSMHRLAQSLRGQNQCGNAARHYESLLSRFPNYGRAPEAMVELADCYRRMGRFDQARRWLTRAQRNSSTAAIASRALRQVEADVANSNARTAAPAAAAEAQ